MLTTPTSGWDEDLDMFSRWGIRGLGSFEGTQAAGRVDDGDEEQIQRPSAGAAAEGSAEPARPPPSAWAAEVGVGSLAAEQPRAV